MASTATTRLRLEKQGLGDNAATWGAPKLNTVLDLVDEAIGGVESIAIAGTTTTLSSTNYTSDQSRNACLVLTGTLGAASSVVVPNVEKLYLIVNNCTMGAYSLTVKTAAGSGVSLKTGPQWVFCDATNVLTGMPRLDQLAAAGAALDMGGYKVTNAGTPTAATDLATKAYADGIAAAGVDLTPYATKASPTFTGSITVPAGTVGSPGIAITSDSNTGIYSAGADLLALTTGGTARAAVSSTGLAVTGSVTASSVVLGDAGTESAPTYSFSGDTNTGMFRSGADQLALTTGGTSRAAITSSGDLYYGQFSTLVPGYSNTTVGHCIRADGRLFSSAASFSALNLNADGSVLLLNRSGVNVGSIAVTTTTTAFNTSSDYRLKTGIEPLTGAVARLAGLKPSRFRFKTQATDAPKIDGFLAHEVTAVVPEAVTGVKDAATMQQLDLSKVVPLLVGAVQELAIRLTAAEAAIKTKKDK